MPAMMPQAGMHMAMPQPQMASSFPGRHGSAPPGSPSQTAGTGLGYRRVSAPAFTRQTRQVLVPDASEYGAPLLCPGASMARVPRCGCRVNSSSSITSTAHSQRHGGGGAAPATSSESASAEATSPSGKRQ